MSLDKRSKSRRSKEHQQWVQDLRKSSASGTHNTYQKYLDEVDSLKEELVDYKESLCL